VKTAFAVKPKMQVRKVKKKVTPAHKKVAPVVPTKPRRLHPRPAPPAGQDPQGY
jgi:hypothetical protein